MPGDRPSGHHTASCGHEQQDGRSCAAPTVASRRHRRSRRRPTRCHGTRQRHLDVVKRSRLSADRSRRHLGASKTETPGRTLAYRGSSTPQKIEIFDGSDRPLPDTTASRRRKDRDVRSPRAAVTRHLKERDAAPASLGKRQLDAFKDRDRLCISKHQHCGSGRRAPSKSRTIWGTDRHTPIDTATGRYVRPGPEQCGISRGRQRHLVVVKNKPEPVGEAASRRHAKIEAHGLFSLARGRRSPRKNRTPSRVQRKR